MSTPINDINQVHQDQLYLYFYEDDLNQTRTKKECAFIAKHCNLSSQHTILDLACGHGRHSNFLANKNYQVTGIDINTKFISIAKQDASSQQNKAFFKQQNILDIDFENEFDTIFLLSNTLGFLNHDDCSTLFAKINKALKIGGRALIDTKNRDHFIKEIKPAYITEKNKDLLIDRLSFNPIDGTTTNNRIYIKDGKRFDTPFTMYLYNYSNLLQMATDHQLKIVKQFGGWDEQAFNAESRRIIVILEKM